MGHRHYQPPEAPPDRRTSLTGALAASLRRAALTLAVLGAVWGAVAALQFRQLTESRERQITDARAGVGAIVDEAQTSLTRDAILLARDVTVYRSAEEPGQWYMESSAMAPQRILVFSVTRGADLLVILNPAGGPVALMPGQTIPKIAPPEKPVGMLGTIDGRAFILGVARFVGMEMSGRPAPGAFGVVILGRRLESLGPRLASLSSRPSLVAVSGDRPLASTLPDTPVTGWATATRSGTIAIRGEPWTVRPFRGFHGGAAWLLLPETEDRAERWQVRRRLLASFGLVAGLALAVVWLTSRR